VSSFSQDWIGYRANDNSHYQITENSLHCPNLKHEYILI
jgi:hypothetical protein